MGWLFWTIIIVNMLQVLFKKNSKLINILSVIGIILFLGGNSYNADYLGYKYLYNNSLLTSFEPGYVLLASITKQLGIDYQGLLLLIISLTSFITYLIVTSLGVHYGLFSIFYLVTMSFLDAVQARQALCYAVFTLALLTLSKGKKVLFGLLVLLASSFQITALLYIPMIIFGAKQHDKSSKFYRIIAGYTMLSCIFVFLNGNSMPFVTRIAANYVSSEKMGYFTTQTRLGFLVFFCFQISCMLMVRLISLYTKEYGNERIEKFSSVVYNSVFYSCVAMPLVMINSNFSRYFKFSLIGLLLLIAYVLYSLREGRQEGERRYILLLVGKKGRDDIFLVLSCIFVLIYWIVLQDTTEVINVFQNNIFG